MDLKHLVSAAELPPQFLKSAFLVGHIPLKTLAYDPRISYSLYIPPEHYTAVTVSQPQNTSPPLPLLIVIHGTRRTVFDSSNGLVEFAHTQKCAVMMPLFPAGLDSPHDLDSYKLLSSRTVRSDLALLAILGEVEKRWPGITTEKVFLMGFSGGGQFVQRFLYLYPERLIAVSIGAPGRATLLDDSLPWPAGIRDVEEVFGRRVDLDKIRAVKAIHLIVGSDDNMVHGGEEFWKWLTEKKKSLYLGKKTAMEGTLEKPRTGRIDLLKELQKSLESQEIRTRIEIVPGVAHNSEQALGTTLDFFRPLLMETHA
ncbi:hypothetical protein BGZ60DRAFT_414848 [Tricladium varicosporioides]|nr:hypothetical protein BGZ60DRAFT_414848 [Hymenoscyphus varicosporioides]